LQVFPEWDAAAGLTRLARQFSNAPFFDAIPFEGEPDRVAFASLVNVAPPGAAPSWTLGRVEYVIDPAARTLRLRQAPYGAVLQEGAPFDERCLATGVVSGHVEYLDRDRAAGNFSWVPRWEPKEEMPYPGMIRVTLSVDTGRGRAIPLVQSAIRPAE